MKIAFLFKRDSHFKAVQSTALRICAQYKCEATFIGIDAEVQYSHESCSVIYIGKDDLSILSGYDYVIACLGGYLLNHVVRALYGTNVKIISVFPGIVSHYQLDAFISRLNVDQVWLNSKADLDLYRVICKVFRRPFNGILYGMSWLENNIQISYNLCQKDKTAIFFEQTEILSSHLKRIEFESCFKRIVGYNPNVLFKYKIRDNSDDFYFSKLRMELASIDNVVIVNKLSDTDIFDASYYLSISSSALIEGLVYGKSTFIIDYSLLNLESKEFFKDSKIILKDFDLSHSRNVNVKWYNKRISTPLDKVDLNSFSKNSGFGKSYNMSRFNIITKLIMLSLLNFQFLLPIFSKTRLASVQKALDYINIK